jgi:sigma-E factor negative regulatory protein RseA
MSDKLKNDAELVSALVDGQLQGEEFSRAVSYLTETEEAREAWDSYNWLGDAMRSGQTPLRAHDRLFVEQFRHRIASDTKSLVTVDDVSKKMDVQRATVMASANDPWWRRVAGLASVVLVCLLAWQGYQFLGQRGQPVPAAQLAQLPVTNEVSIATAGTDGAMIRDSRLDALLAAHRQFGGISALQMPAGFLRNATFEEDSR